MVNSKFFNSEKNFKRTFLTALFVIFASAISCCVFSENTHAYYVKNSDGTSCYSIAFTTTSQKPGETAVSKSVSSTEQVCTTSSGSLAGKDDPPEGTHLIAGGNSPLDYPKLETKNNKVTVTYCKDGSTSCSSGDTATKTFTYNEGDSFEDFANSIQDFADKNIKSTENTTLQGLDENTDITGAHEQGREESQENIDDNECRKVLTLGWIVCPIIRNMRDAIEKMYDGIVEPFLNIDTEILTGDGSSDGGVFSAWQIFQNLANIVLIIIVLVVIFSQLTGVGIDNYGIKRMLPRLIVAIVLINLSYIICQLAVDLSNILGYSLRTLFEGLTDYNSLSTTSTSGAGASIASGIVIAAAIGVMFAAGWAEIVLMIPALLGGLVAAVVSLFFVFILLGVRQAAVIIFVAIAPLAFVCYILPNTKKIFDKWLKIFEALLLVFPICGALMGASSFASALLLNSNPNGDFWYGLIAMLIQVVPFFFIPAILKGSFAALGNLGNKISGFGNRAGHRLGGATRGAVSNAERYKALSGLLGNRKADLRASKVGNRQNKAFDRIAKKQYGKAFNELSKDQQEAIKDRVNNSLTGNMRNRMLASYTGEAEKLSSGAAMGAAIAAGEGGVVGYLAATEEKNRTEAAIADQERRNWSRQMFQDENGNRFMQDRTGNFVALDPKSKKKQYTAEEARKMLEKDGSRARMTSYAEGMKNQAGVQNEKRVGSVAGYAGVNNIGALETAALKSSAAATGQSLEDTLLHGRDDVIEASNIKAENQRTTTAAEAKAGVVKIDHGVAARNAEATRNFAEAKNSLDVTPEVTPEYAKSLETQRYDASQQKIYGEEFKLKTRGDVVGSLKSILTGQGDHATDANYAVAALDDVIAKGGYADAMDAVYNMSTQDNNVASAVYNKIATISEPAFKQYGKYRIEAKSLGAKDYEIASFADWVNGNVTTELENKSKISQEKSSLKAYNDANGNNALVNATKDAFKFYKEHPGTVTLPAVAIGVINAQDNEARLAGESLLRSMAQDPATINDTMGSLSKSQWAKIQPSTLAALVGVKELNSATPSAEYDQQLSDLKKAINDPNNASVFSGMNPQVRDFINKASFQINQQSQPTQPLGQDSYGNHDSGEQNDTSPFERGKHDEEYKGKHFRPEDNDENS